MILLGKSLTAIFGGGGETGASTFAALTDKATVDIPATNTPTATAINARESSSNKKTDVDVNKTSDTFFPTVKAVYNWAVGLFVSGAASSTDNTVVRWDGSTGKKVQYSEVIIDDAGTLTAPKMTTTNSGVFFQPYSLAAYYPVFNGNGGDVQLLVQRGTNKAVGFGANTAGALRFMSFSDALPLTASLMMEILPSGLLTLPSIKAGQIIDNVGSSGTDGQVLKKVGGVVLWSNP